MNDNEYTFDRNSKVFKPFDVTEMQMAILAITMYSLVQQLSDASESRVYTCQLQMLSRMIREKQKSIYFSG